MIPRDRFRAFAPLAAITFVLAIVASTLPARSADTVTLRVGTVSSITEAAINLADRLGYFRDEGIVPEYVPFSSATGMVAPLGQGQLDVGSGAPVAALYNAVARGVDVRVVADMATDAPGYGFQKLLVRTDLIKSGRYKSPKDLKGMVIAGNCPGSVSSSQLNRLLESAGLKLTDVKRIFLDFPEHVTALANKAVDASLMPEPNATLAARSGSAQIVASDDAYYPNQQITVVLFGANLLKKNPDLGVRFMRAYLRGARFYHSALAKGKIAGPNADQVIRILTESTRIKDPAVYRSATPHSNDPDGRLNLASMRTDFAFFKEQGFIEGNVTVESAIDDSYVAKALKTLGPYKRR